MWDKFWDKFLDDPMVIFVLVLAAISLFFIAFNTLNAIFTSGLMIGAVVGGIVALAGIYVYKEMASQE
ncbi:MAG: hypothetical protein ACTSSP_04050 [Candidatus Asgardarchaeia archaeon]